MKYLKELPSNLGDYKLRKLSINNFHTVDYSKKNMSIRFISLKTYDEKDITTNILYEVVSTSITDAESKMLAKLNLIEQVKKDFDKTWNLELNPILQLIDSFGRKIFVKSFTVFDLWNLENNTKALAIISLKISDEIKIILEWIKHYISQDISKNIRLAGKEFDSKDTIYNNVVYIYTTETEADISIIREQLKENNLTLKMRDNKYRESLKPDFFISHDSRDKVNVAKPLYDELTKKGYKVWYDEFSLKIGDSLTESIEKGIKECRHGILILSKNFLSNEKWAKNELQSLKTRQIVMNEKIILPIWHEINEFDLIDNYWLLDKVGGNTDGGIPKLAEKIHESVK